MRHFHDVTFFLSKCKTKTTFRDKVFVCVKFGIYSNCLLHCEHIKRFDLVLWKSEFLWRHVLFNIQCLRFERNMFTNRRKCNKEKNQWFWRWIWNLLHIQIQKSTSSHILYLYITEFYRFNESDIFTDCYVKVGHSSNLMYEGFAEKFSTCTYTGKN